jgi:membrane protease YdiL (CAAX protease family)
MAMLVIPVTELVPWLGFAFPRLRVRYGAPTAIVLVGLAWSLFDFQKHWFLEPRVGPGTALIVIVYMAAGAIVFGWISLRSRGSLLFPFSPLPASI